VSYSDERITNQIDDAERAWQRRQRTREIMAGNPEGLAPDVSREAEIAGEVEVHERLEESRRLAAAMPVLAVVHALTAGRSTPPLTLDEMKREMNVSFGRTVAR
jgi:hypothetical protein